MLKVPFNNQIQLLSSIGMAHFFKSSHAYPSCTLSHMQANWFIALKAPIDLRLDPLLVNIPSKMRIFTSTDRHITLAFLGNCTQSEAYAAWERACQALPHVQELQPEKLALMGPPKKPSAVAITFQNPRRLIHWMTEHRSEILANAQRPPAKYPPLPHMTIARPNRRARDEERQAMMDWCTHTEVSLPKIGFHNIALYTWSTDRRAHLFQRIEEAPLRHHCGETDCTGHNHEWERCTTNGF